MDECMHAHPQRPMWSHIPPFIEYLPRQAALLSAWPLHILCLINHLQRCEGQSTHHRYHHRFVISCVRSSPAIVIVCPALMSFPCVLLTCPSFVQSSPCAPLCLCQFVMWFHLPMFQPFSQFFPVVFICFLNLVYFSGFGMSPLLNKSLMWTGTAYAFCI